MKKEEDGGGDRQQSEAEPAQTVKALDNPSVSEGVASHATVESLQVSVKDLTIKENTELPSDEMVKESETDQDDNKVIVNKNFSEGSDIKKDKALEDSDNNTEKMPDNS